MITLGLQDLRFLLSRSRGEWLPEELNGLAPLGPTGVRHVEGFGNNTTNMSVRETMDSRPTSREASSCAWNWPPSVMK